jgi:DNA-binding NarL/FixJ family response regulator
VVLVDDHAVMRAGLKMMLESSGDYKVVAECQDGLEATRVVPKEEPDLVMMDLSMPKMHGLEAVREIKTSNPEIKILVLTVHKNEEYVLAAFEAGSDGFCLKHADKDELLMAVKSVMKGERFISPLVSDQVIEGYLHGSRNLKESSAYDSLTGRERQVLKLMTEDYTNKKIAQELFISVKTVETHRANLMRKLDLHSASELSVFAVKKGLIAGEA